MEKNNELYIPIPVDIDTVKSKFLLGLTLRQIVCFGIGIGLGLAVYFACKGLLGDSIAGILMMFIMLPAFFFSVYEQNGEPLEVIIRRISNMTGGKCSRCRKDLYAVNGQYGLYVKCAENHIYKLDEI